MKDNKRSDYARARQNFTDSRINKKLSWVFFVLLLMLYIISTVLVSVTSRSGGSLTIFGHHVPYHTITGALSSTANLCTVFLVVFFGIPGFITSLTMVLAQFPALVVSLFVRHNYMSIAGFFSNNLILCSILLLYINNRKIERYQCEMQEYTTTDMLTKLPNRLACHMYLEELVRCNASFAIAILNLNHFKNIKSTMGQAVGDDVLAEIASRLKAVSSTGKSSTRIYIAYNGSDEFTLIIRSYNKDKLLTILENYQSAVSKPITISGCEYFITSRVGYAEYPHDAKNIESLYTCALIAMTNARNHADKNYILGFTSDMYSQERELETERKIRDSLKEDRLHFYLQPQYDISHNLRGFEVLARIFNPDGTIVNPSEFIPVAEKVGLIDSIDNAVFKESAQFLSDLIRRTNTDIIFSVNVSVRHLMKKNFINEVKEILDSADIPANRIEIEITESIMINSIDEALNSINELKGLGLNIAIDDFGTGYSSLSYLNNFPSDIIKIDKSFIEKITFGNSHKQYVAAIISIGHIMNFKVVAEGVETAEELEILRSIGCDYVHGFYWGVPMPPEEAEKLV